MSPAKNSDILAERSPNTSSPSKAATGAINPAMADFPKFQHKSLNMAGMQNGTYVSPSDAMQSPTTKKLSAIKGKRFGSAKPQNLFAKVVAARPAEQNNA